MTTTGAGEQPTASESGAIPSPFAREASEVVAALASDAENGLTQADATTRRSQYGPNEITAEKPASVVQIVLGLVRDPMNIMLIAVTIVSFAIDETSTAII